MPDGRADLQDDYAGQQVPGIGSCCGFPSPSSPGACSLSSWKDLIAVLPVLAAQPAGVSTYFSGIDLKLAKPMHLLDFIDVIDNTTLSYHSKYVLAEERVLTRDVSVLADVLLSFKRFCEEKLRRHMRLVSAF